MLKFETVTAVAVPMPQANIDTDQIIPARFLCMPREAGLAKYLFHDQRGIGEGPVNPDHVLNQAVYQDAGIIVAGPNFGCGSSREHAICALLHAGIRVVIAPGISDIFVGNALENGLLPVSLSHSEVAGFLTQLAASPGASMSVDLAAQCVRAPDGTTAHFAIDARRKNCLMSGLNSIELTLQSREAIATFEKTHQTWL